MDYLPYILIAVALLIVGMQMLLFYSAKGAQGKPAPDYTALVNDAQRGMPVLLFYFHSEHCGPCRRITPLVEAFAAQTGAVIIVDVGQQPEAALQFGVRVTPTLMHVRNGMIEKVVLGEVTEDKLRQMLE